MTWDKLMLDFVCNRKIFLSIDLILLMFTKNGFKKQGLCFYFFTKWDKIYFYILCFPTGQSLCLLDIHFLNSNLGYSY